jgi:polyisoprenoid-binding protein YceI
MKLLSLAPLALAICLTPALVSAAPEDFKVDAVHSSVIFKIKHMNVANFYGRFNKVEGTITQDKEKPENGKLVVKIDATSIDTGNVKRDEHVKGPDFLNVKQYPTIEYKSTAIKAVSENEFEVTGDMTLHGQTKPVTAKMQKTGETTDQKGTHRLGGETTFTFKRSDFGMNKMLENLGDEITVTVAIEATREGGEQ